MPKHRKQEDRDKAVEAYLAGEPAADIAARLKISRPAVYQWVNAYKEKHPEGSRPKPAEDNPRVFKSRAELDKMTPAELREELLRARAEVDRMKRALLAMIQG